MAKEGCCAGCREEMRCENFGLSHPKPWLFVSAQWNWHPLVYIVYRGVWAVYFTVWVVLAGTRNNTGAFAEPDRVKFFIYLTNWALLFLSTGLVVQFIMAIVGYVKFGKHYPSDDAGEPEEMPWYYKMAWVWYSTATASSLTVSLAYWALLHADSGATVGYDINFNEHGMNSIYILLDLFITAMPLRIYHMLYPMVFGLLYMVFSIIYDFAGGTSKGTNPYIYSILDWSADGGTAALYAVIVEFVGIPIMHLVAYGLYRIRLLMYSCCCGARIGKNDIV